MITHKNSVHLNVRYECDFKDCKKSFSDKRIWSRHKIFHENPDVLKFDYKECGKILANKQNLLRHKRTHSGE